MRPRHCVFCGAFKLTREHFWPEWMHQHLPEENAPAHVEQIRIYDRKTVLVGMPRNVERQGGTRTKTMRIVCGSCNAGWMSGIETTTKLIMVPMLAGTPTVLSEHQRYDLARWVALKVILANANVPRDTVLTRNERCAFMTDAAMPDDLTVWIGRTNGSAWSSLFHRRAATIVASRDNPPPGKNLQHITFGAGHLLVLAILDRGRIGFRVDPDFEVKMPRLWPLQMADLAWPPPQIISDVEAHSLATALDSVIRSPMLRWAPHPNTT